MARPAESNVLSTLDGQKPSAFYWQLTLLATLGGFLFGYDTSNIGSALNFVPYNLHGLARAISCRGRRSARPRGHPRRPGVRPLRPQDRC